MQPKWKLDCVCVLTPAKYKQTRCGGSAYDCLSIRPLTTHAGEDGVSILYIRTMRDSHSALECWGVG